MKPAAAYVVDSAGNIERGQHDSARRIGFRDEIAGEIIAVAHAVDVAFSVLRAVQHTSHRVEVVEGVARNECSAGCDRSQFPECILPGRSDAIVFVADCRGLIWVVGIGSS